MALQYRTRGNSTPQGKPRVYFCCHPKDFGIYFEAVCKEVLEKQNCAVWFADVSDLRDEAFLQDLSQMQLFVMPVTSRLLREDSHGMTEFRFAIQNHIPVLPLMQETGLESLFNEVCGDLQFLDPNARDATAISYDEKLTKYLDSVLIGDELAEKIRAAFDAYVFLSYRKKDRKYAQELMRLIHRNDFCRDIAIWYDEFLTPGENFNDSIKDALEKSGLFVLAVTPNLVNEVNYVMTTEYPMAVEQGKPILPAEMVPTDPNQLAKCYQGIPASTDAHDSPMLTAALLDAICRMARKENDSSPEHNFFIGLAYLGGVDVEVDYERAVELITSAAEDGLIEAVDKLIEMYETGHGVERDYHIGIQLREYKIQLLKEVYETDLTEEICDDLFWAHIHCGDRLQAFGRLKSARKYYTDAEALVHGFSSPDMRRNRAAAYERLGNIYRTLGDLQGAKVFYEKSLVIAEALAKEIDTPEAKRDLSVNFEKLGKIFQLLGDLKGAKAFYEKSLTIREALAMETDTPEARRGLSVSLHKMGITFQALGDLQGAKAFYEKALVIFEALVKETDTPEAKRDLSVSFENLGNIYTSLGDLKGAKAFYEKSLAIAEALAKQIDTPEAKRNLSVSFNNLGNILQTLGDLQGAKAFYKKALAIREALVKEIDTPEAKSDLSVSFEKLGIIFQALGDLQGAKAFYEKALASAEALVKEIDTPEARRGLSISLENLGIISQALGDLQGAKAFYAKALAIREALAKQIDTPESKRDLSVSFNKLGEISQALGDLQSAKVFYEKSLVIFEALAKKTNTPEARRDLSLSFEKLGNTCKALGDLQGAKTFYEKSLAIRDALVKEIDTPETWDDLAVSYYKLATMSEPIDKNYLQKAATIWERLSRECPHNPRYSQNLGIVQRLLQASSGSDPSWKKYK